MPRPGRRWKPPGTRCRPCPAGPSWRNSPPTCPRLWHAPATSSKDRKRLLRTLITDVTLLPEPDPGMVRIGIRWHTGATDELRVGRAVHRGTARRSPSPAVEMVRQLGPVTPAAELARRLNAAGLTTGHGRPFDAKAVQWIRHAYHIPAPAPYADGEISVAEAARQLGCSAGVIYDWIQAGQLDARRGPGNRLRITWNDRIRGRLPRAHRRIRAPQPRGPPHQAPSAAEPGPQCHHRMPCSCQQVQRPGLTSANQHQSRTSRQKAAGGAV